MICLPSQPARMILNEVALRQCPLLEVDNFIEFCKDRNLEVSRKRLDRFERLGLLRPIVRLKKVDSGSLVLSLDGEPVDGAFEDGAAIDTCAPDADYEPAPIEDEDWMPFYSAFQTWELDQVLWRMSSVNWLENYADVDVPAFDWIEQLKQDFHRNADSLKDTARERQAIAVLGQYISDTYYPRSLSDQRTFRVSSPSHYCQWLTYHSDSWSWSEHVDAWEPEKITDLFCIDRESLKRIHLRLAIDIRSCDPLWHWSNLVRFVSSTKREQLGGDALRAQTYRQLADMIQRLHSDLYDEDLGPLEERFGTTVNHIPELAVREDLRKHLEYVVNQYNINPQPRASLFVEGETEVKFIETFYPKWFGNHYGVPGIEVVNLQGVDNATGSKKEDRYSAIFRLADYLHHHQTFVYVMLDNENHATPLRKNARARRSLYGHRKRAIPPGRIKVWRKDFEFDNFSDTELASALTTVSNDAAEFSRQEVHEIRELRSDKKSDRKIADLFREKAGWSLNKPELGVVLADIVLDPKTRKRPKNRPIVKLLDRIHDQAVRNPLPILQRSWEQNQKAMDQEPIRRKR